MAVIKQSFLSNLLRSLFDEDMGTDIYNWFKGYARIIVAIGTCILCILIGLSTICHFSFLSDLVVGVTGTSILFLVYVVAFIILLDVEVEVEKEEPDYYVSKPIKKPKTMKYKLTILWGVFLLAFGVCAICFTNKYRKLYAFECSTFLVDHNAKEYHLYWDNDCKVKAKAHNLEKMKGYQINKSYTLCEWCKEWEEEAVATYNSERYIHK